MGRCGLLMNKTMPSQHFQTDVLGVQIAIAEDHLTALMTALPIQQRRYAKCAALACRSPREIRLIWERDPKDSGAWLKLRTYFELYEITFESSDTESDKGMNVFVMVRFAWIQNTWALR
jgi:hypothetical protein